MLQGKSLVQMAQALQDLRDNAKDFVVPVERMEAQVVEVDPTPEAPTGQALALSFENGHTHHVRPNNWSRRQLAEYTDIPSKYVDRLALENPRLLVDNVNHGIQRIPKRQKNGKPESRMIRTYRDNMRAFLSSRFRRFDGYDLLETVLPIFMEQRFQVVSSEITERRIYVKAVTDKLQAEIKKGDVVRYGLMVSSSDVGAGRLMVEPFTERLVCLNGAISANVIKRTHVGRDQAEDDVYELLTDNTKELTDAAFWAQVRDVVKASMGKEMFERDVDAFRRAAGMAIKNYDIPEVVELSMKALGISGEYTKNSVVGYLANGADGAGLNMWGLINGFTFAAQDEYMKGGNRYDESIELERTATKLLGLNAKEWERIAA